MERVCKYQDLLHLRPYLLEALKLVSGGECRPDERRPAGKGMWTVRLWIASFRPQCPAGPRSSTAPQTRTGSSGRPPFRLLRHPERRPFGNTGNDGTPPTLNTSKETQEAAPVSGDTTGGSAGRITSGVSASSAELRPSTR
jgi:hypothetical protein